MLDLDLYVIWMTVKLAENMVLGRKNPVITLLLAAMNISLTSGFKWALLMVPAP